MEQSEENLFIIDLGNIDTAPDIIFELSSVLDSDEAKNKRICLKLGNISLNQAQLLSIKSLINGIESTLSSIDTKSVETEKVALSLGIIVSNISAENSLEITPEMTYKTAEEYKEEQNSKEVYLTEETSSEIIETKENTNKEPKVSENMEEAKEDTNEEPKVSENLEEEKEDTNEEPKV